MSTPLSIPGEAPLPQEVIHIRRPRRRGYFIASALGLGLFLAAGLCEVMLRVYLACRGWTPNCYAAELDLFQPDPETGTTLKKNFRLKSGVWRISTNSLGLRGPEIPIQKPTGTIRIAIVGESSAFGYLVDDGQEAARILEASLREAGQVVEVLNAGVPSYNMFQGRIRFRQVVAPLHPDIVVCYMGWNDLGYVTHPNPTADRFRFREIAPAWERLCAKSVTYSLVTRRLLSPAARLPAAELASYTTTLQGQSQFCSNFNGFLDEIQAAGAEPMIALQITAARPDVDETLRGFLGHTPEQHAALIGLATWLRDTERSIAIERQVSLVDGGDSVPPRSLYLKDHIHLSAAGEIELARVLKEGLLPILDRHSLTKSLREHEPPREP